MIQSIKNFFERNQKGIIIISFISLFCIGLINFYFVFAVNATSNDECLWVPKEIKKDSVAIVFDKVKKGDKLIEIKVEIKKLIHMGQFAFMLMGQIWLIIGFIVLTARPNGYIQRLFYKISAAFIVLFTSVYFLGLGTDIRQVFL